MSDENSQSENLDQDPKLKKSFELIRNKNFSEALTVIEHEIQVSQQKNWREREGVFWSALGVLWRAQRHLKKAYKAYQNAEKCLPDDMSLKMITARLLLEEFHQSDMALRKLDQILKNTSDDLVMQHHAKVLKAMALFRLGKKPDAKALWQDVVDSDFSILKSATNLNFKACEFFLKKNFAKDLCLTYLKKAQVLAKHHGEAALVKVLSELQKTFSEK